MTLRKPVHLFKKYLVFSNQINFCQLAGDLENGVKSSKHSLLFRSFFRCSCASLVGIKTKMQEIYHYNEIFTYLSPPVTLKIRSRSPKSNQLLSLSQRYIHASLVTFHPLVQEISFKQESVKPTQKISL